MAAARRELLALHGQVLGREDVVGQVERLARADLAALAVAEQDRRPDDGVEDDVVLALEVRVQCVLVLPPLAPGVRLAAQRAPTRCSPTGSRSPRRTRRRSACSGPRRSRGSGCARPSRGRASSDAAGCRRRGPSEKLRTFGRQPRARSIQAAQRLRERRQVEEEVVRLAELRRRAVDLRARVDQVGRVELVAAVVALVAARLRVAADRARALDVAVGERVPGRRRERDELGPLDDRAAARRAS